MSIAPEEVIAAALLNGPYKSLAGCDRYSDERLE